MKVFCINDGKWGCPVRDFFGFLSAIRIVDGPKYGDIDVVVEEIEKPDATYYTLQAWPGRAYDSVQFIPVSEIDETTFKREPIKKQWPVDRAIK